MDRELQRAKRRSLADEVNRGGLRTFYAKVLAQNDEVVRDVARKLPSLPASQQAFISEALRRCGTQACARVINAPPRNDSIAAGITTPADLDDRWAAFFATGDAKYVREIIEALAWLEESHEMKLLMGGAARFSLASNAFQHKRVLAICEESAGVSVEPMKGRLKEIISLAKAERAKKRSPEPE